MTSVERMFALYSSVNYILENNIQGEFVECGVWRGGSSMLIAKMLSNRKINDRKIYLYDTFEGMTKPGEKDGEKEKAEWEKYKVNEQLNKRKTINILQEEKDKNTDRKSIKFF